jgi:hypothetical protein
LHVLAQGKSVLIHTIVACLRTLGKTVETCAPTGIAASNVGGLWLSNVQQGASAQRHLNAA